MSESHKSIPKWAIGLAIGGGIAFLSYAYSQTSALKRKRHYQVLLSRDLASDQKIIGMVKDCEPNSLEITDAPSQLKQITFPLALKDFFASDCLPLLQALSKNVDLFVLCEECGSTQIEIEKYRGLNTRRHINSLVVTLNQTQGKGRRANKWVSIPGNIYMTLSYNYISAVLPLKFSMILLTSIVKILRDLLPNQRVMIKWPNDVYLNDNKICGILCESVQVPEDATIQYCKSGIGINIESGNGFKGIRELAGLDKTKNLRPQLIYSIVNEFFENLYQCEAESKFNELLKTTFEYFLISNSKLNIKNAETGATEVLNICGIDETTLYPIGVANDGQKYLVFPADLHLTDGCEARIKKLAVKEQTEDIGF